MPKKQYIPVPLYLTDEKVAEIKRDLAELENVIMPSIRKRLSVAYEDGDIPENNPWLTAAEELNEAMHQRNVLVDMLSRRKKPPEKSKSTKISLGSSVNIKVGASSLISIVLVSSEEADPVMNKLSVDSPIGSALVGKKRGDHVIAKTPSGDIPIEILDS